MILHESMTYGQLYMQLNKYKNADPFVFDTNSLTVIIWNDVAMFIPLTPLNSFYNKEKEPKRLRTQICLLSAHAKQHHKIMTWTAWNSSEVPKESTCCG